MTNFVVLSPCRLQAEPQQRSDKAPVQLRVSTSRRVKNATTQEMEWQSSFFNVIVWGDDRPSAKQLEKGTTLHIVGRLDVNQWTDKHDQKREDVRIVADNLSITLPEAPNMNGEEDQTEKQTDEPEWSF